MVFCCNPNNEPENKCFDFWLTKKSLLFLILLNNYEQKFKTSLKLSIGGKLSMWVDSRKDDL